MPERKIHGLIKCGIFGLAVGLLCEAIRRAVNPIIWEFLKDYRGKLHWSLGGWQNFYHLLPQLMVPGLVLAAPIAFSVEGLFTARVEGNRRYRAVFILSLAYLGLAGVMEFVYMLVLESGRSSMSGEWNYMMLVPLMLLLPHHALSVFGFWLPSVATALYCRFSKRPQWWLSGLIGTLTLIAGVLFWTLMGVLVGAETD
jgi:hypothetical protein